MKHGFLPAALCCIAAVSGCAEARRPQIETIVKDRITAQTDAWNRGDIDGALDAYCPSEDIVWTSKSGVARGYAPFAEDMRSFFGGGAQGVMANEVLYAARFGETVLVTLRWAAERNGARVLGGVSTQIWAPCAGAMRVVYEHAS
jgi:ketosteroid isomerase-like protein